MQRLLQRTALLELLILLIELQRGSRVLDGVVRVLLNVDVEEVTREEAQTELALVGKGEQLDRIEYLTRRNVQVDHLERKQKAARGRQV